MNRMQWLPAAGIALALGLGSATSALAQDPAGTSGYPDENVPMQPWSPADPASPGAIDDSGVNTPSTGPQGPIRSDRMDSMNSDDTGTGRGYQGRMQRSDQGYTGAERAFSSYLNWQRTGSEMETP